MNIKVLSLFSGCGGMDLGLLGGFKFLGKNFKKNNFEIVQAIDNDHRVLHLYNKNFKKVAELKNIIEKPSNEFKPHDLLIGGFPCQSFSVVAQNPKRLGFKDEKGKLFFEICRILRFAKPRCFLVENVKGLLSANNGQAFDLIIKEFQSSGYFVKYKLLNSSEFGIPQKRERIFIIGFLEKKDFEDFEFPNPTTLSKDSKIPLRDVIDKEENANEKLFFSAKALEGLKKTKHFKSMNKGRAQDINLPCNTVGSHLAKVSLNSTDPVLAIGDRYRMFSPREVARIQSFPEDFKLASLRQWNYIALGNAVPPVMMWYIAIQIQKVLAKK